MSTSPPNPPSPSVPLSKSGARAALEYTGIPASWFDKRPKLPSRNWLIFIGVTSSVLGYYAYDRRQSKQIREEYVARVKHLAEEPLHSLDFPRKVTVYGAKWPGDDDWDRSTRYFRKYVKPIFVAAAIDYTIIAGKRHGDLATRIANDIKSERRIALGLDHPAQIALPRAPETPEAKYRRALDGGTVIVGRPAFKEYMAGLRRGWIETLEKVDEDEIIARSLASDGRFDEPEPIAAATFGDDEPLPTQSRFPSSSPPPGIFSPLGSMRSPLPQPSSSSTKRDPGADVPPPSRIPDQPPLLLVPFVNLVGVKLIPQMIWEFFNERHKVRAGAEAAYRLVVRETRPFVAQSFESELLGPDTASPPQTEDTDLGFDASAETYYRSSVAVTPEDIEKARESYYKALAEKLATARELARGERQPSEAERNAPPPTEVELRAERLKKEKRWRGDERGWEIVKPGTPVEWDSRMDGALSLFVDPQAGDVWNENGKSSW